MKFSNDFFFQQTYTKPKQKTTYTAWYAVLYMLGVSQIILWLIKLYTETMCWWEMLMES